MTIIIADTKKGVFTLKLKIIEKSAIIGLILALLFSFISFYITCGHIRDNVVRLHILANSNSAYDQQLKLKVRDRILKESETLLCGFDTKEQALAEIQNRTADLQVAALDELRKNNCDYDVCVSVEPTYFETRTYETVTLPAGNYTALKIKIGKAQGKNWWCVMFPQMCVPTVSKRNDVSETLNSNETQIVKNREKYKVGFWLVELIEQVKSKF